MPSPEWSTASASPQLPTTPERSLLSREIERSDFEEVSEFLGQRIGYPRGYFMELLQRMTKLPAISGYPRYGRILIYGSKVVGAIILIFSMRTRQEAIPVVRCHVTGWAVEPAFKPMATFFFARDVAQKDVTYLNLSASWSPRTIPIIEAQGFVRYSDGEFLSVPALEFSAPGKKVVIVSGESLPNMSFEASDRNLLLDHSSFGCISLWCLTPERAYPFVFRPRLFKRIIPGAQLIYCSDIEHFVRFAGPIGRYLARRGKYVVRIDANGPILGLVGVYQHGVDCRYCKGTKPPLGDLAYTHLAMCDYVPRKKLVE
jgi:hypothetical protein